MVAGAKPGQRAIGALGAARTSVRDAASYVNRSPAAVPGRHNRRRQLHRLSTTWGVFVFAYEHIDPSAAEVGAVQTLRFIA